ncbi:MAG: hypothetical protein Q8Q14_00650 [Gemmatimonadales bacterium]|nr:hypothetical protein [Gemmatimonadales bacterium]
MTPKRWPWDVDIDTTRVGLERCMRALIETESTMTSSMRLSKRMGRGVSAFLRVHVPEGREANFRAIARPIEMRPMPRVQVGMEQSVDDGHPGRTRTEDER